MFRRVGRRAAVKGAVAVGAVCALGVFPSDGGVEASGVELRPAGEGDEVARRWRLAGHRVLRVGGVADVVAGAAGGLTVAVVRDGAAELAVGVAGGVGAPVVWEVAPSGGRTPRPDLTAALRGNLARARAGRRTPVLGPGRAEASHAVGYCAFLRATAAGLLLLCSRGVAAACQAGFSVSMAAITWCA